MNKELTALSEDHVLRSRSSERLRKKLSSPFKEEKFSARRQESCKPSLLILLLVAVIVIARASFRSASTVQTFLDSYTKEMSSQQKQRRKSDAPRCIKWGGDKTPSKSSAGDLKNSRSMSPHPRMTDVESTAVLCENFTEYLIQRIMARFGEKSWREMDNNERESFQTQLLQDNTMFQRELLQAFLPARAPVQTSTVHFITNNSKVLCRYFYDVGQNFYNGVQNFVDNYADTGIIYESAIKLGNKMNEVQTFSLPSHLYSPMFIHMKDFFPHELSTPHAYPESQQFTESVLVSAIKKSLRVWKSKMSWLITVISTTSIEECILDQLWLAAYMRNLREESMVLSRLCKTLEMSRNPIVCYLCPNPVRRKSRNSKIEALTKVIRKYVKGELTIDCNLRLGTVLLLSTQPADIVWSTLREYFGKQGKEGSLKLTKAQVRILELMSKWSKLEGLVVPPSLAPEISSFFMEHNLCSSESSVTSNDAASTDSETMFYPPSPTPLLQPSSVITETCSTIPIYKMSSGLPPYNAFQHYRPREVAEQLTILARSMYLDIKQCLVGLWWSKPSKIALAQPITSFASHIDNLSQWAGTVISASVNRKQSLSFIIKVAWELLDLANFSSLCGILNGLVVTMTASIVQKTLPTLSRKAQDRWKILEPIINPAGNFQRVRQLTELSTKDTTIPYLALLLSDITMLVEVVSLDPFNLDNFVTISKILNSFFRFVTYEPYLTEIPPLLSYLEALPSLTLDLLNRNNLLEESLD